MAITSRPSDRKPVQLGHLETCRRFRGAESQVRGQISLEKAHIVKNRRSGASDAALTQYFPARRAIRLTIRPGASPEDRVVAARPF